MALSTEQQMLVEQRLANEKKSTGVSYLLWFFLGSLGAHRFYLGSIGPGVAQLVLIWGGLILFAVVIGIPMLIAGAIWVFIDVFLIGGMIEKDTSLRRTRIAGEVSALTNS